MSDPFYFGSGENTPIAKPRAKIAPQKYGRGGGQVSNGVAPLSMNRLLPNKPAYTRFSRWPLVIALSIVVLDHITKYLVVSRLSEGSRITIIRDFFDLVHYRNPGAAWGILAAQTPLLSIVSILVIIVVVVAFPKITERVPERCLALGLVIGGIVGNLIDRVLWGEVIDFLDFYLASYHWPAFNVADSAISCGVCLFIFSSFFQHEHAGNQSDHAAEKPST